MPTTPTEKKHVFVLQYQDDPEGYSEDELVDGQSPWEDRDEYPTLESAQENVAMLEERLRLNWERRRSGPSTRRMTVQLTRVNLEEQLERVRKTHARHFPSESPDDYKRPEYPKYRIVKRTFVEEEAVKSE